MRDDRQPLQFFDLIARHWDARAAVNQIVFNNDVTTVAFVCDAAVALAATADKSPPKARVRRAVDTAQLSIKPREGSYPGLKFADHPEGRASTLGTFGDSRFLFGKEGGRMNSVTPAGLCVHLPLKADGTVAAVAEADGLVAYAVGSAVHLWHPDRDPQQLTAHDTVSALRFSPDGQFLAIGHATGVLIWSEQTSRAVALDAPPLALQWSADGRWLACPLGPAGLALIDLPDLACKVYGHFPGPVTSAGFGATSVVSSGAFRATAWALEDGAPIVTGKSGLVLVDAVATNPGRNLVAIGYANGLLSLSQIGSPAEVLLRQDTGYGVSALAWSSCGRFLGVGGRDGSAALVEFPDEMFKS